MCQYNLPIIQNAPLYCGILTMEGAISIRRGKVHGKSIPSHVCCEPDTALNITSIKKKKKQVQQVCGETRKFIHC